MKRSNILIRPARPSDIPGIRDVHGLSVRVLSSSYYSSRVISGWAAKKKPERYLKAMESGEKMFVALSGSRVVGFASVRKNEIYAVYVHPDFARHGVGRRLLLAVERWAAKLGYTSTRLGSSLNGMGFYLKCGYRPVKVDKILMRNIGLRIPYLAMKKQPKSPCFIRVYHYRLDPRKISHFLKVQRQARRLYRTFVPCKTAQIQDAADSSRWTEIHWGRSKGAYERGLARVNQNKGANRLRQALKTCLNLRHKVIDEATWSA